MSLAAGSTSRTNPADSAYPATATAAASSTTCCGIAEPAAPATAAGRPELISRILATTASTWRRWVVGLAAPPG